MKRVGVVILCMLVLSGCTAENNGTSDPGSSTFSVTMTPTEVPVTSDQAGDSGSVLEGKQAGRARLAVSSKPDPHGDTEVQADGILLVKYYTAQERCGENHQGSVEHQGPLPFCIPPEYAC